MFCRKCGTKLPDDAQFCVSCGCQIEGDNSLKNEVQTKSDFRERDVTVTHSAMDGFQIKNTAFKDRVESTDDKELNDKLFTLYDMLIVPVKYIENKAISAHNYEQLSKDKSVVRDGFMRLNFRILIFVYIVNVISAFACFATENKVLHAYYDYYNELWGTSYESDTDMPHYLPNGKSIYIDGAEHFFKSGKLYYAYVMKIEDVSSEHGLTWMFFVGSFFNAIFLTFVCAIIMLIKGFISMKKRVSTYTILAKRDKEEAMQILEAISEHLKYVPVDCRNSIALEFFAKSYRNTLVSNLSEAVKEYTLYKRHDEIMTSLDEMKNQLKDIANSLRNISFAQNMIVSELANLNNLMGMQNLLTAFK